MDDEAVLKLNLERLERGLFVPGQGPSAGLELGDPRLDPITDAAFRSKYAVSAALAQQLWDEGVHDVRIVGYLVYGFYAARSIYGLPWLFRQLAAFVGEHWEAVGPAKKDKLTDGALSWLFQTMSRSLESHEKLKDDVYRTWVEEAGLAALHDATNAAAELLEVLDQRLPETKCCERLRKLSGWLRELTTTLARAAEAEARAAEAEARAAEAPPEEAVAPPAPSDDSTGTAEPAARSPGSAVTASVMVEGSAPLGLLIRKLALFEQLLAKEDLLKAAVVARDIETSMQEFNAVHFLPRLFVPFLRARARNLELLEPMLSQLENPLYKPLLQLYHADLDAFVSN